MTQSIAKPKIPSDEPQVSVPELAAAEQAFSRGDFAALPALLGATQSEAAAKRASELRHAAEVDRLHALALALCLLGLIAVAAGYF